MKKYKMTSTDECPRCGLTETAEHLLWECVHVQQIWNKYNNLIRKMGKEQDLVRNYNNVYRTGPNPISTLIKIKVIKELIQIERPKNWDDNRMESLVKEIINNERYIAKKKYLLGKFLSKWDLDV
jgi:hypothetical protein